MSDLTAPIALLVGVAARLAVPILVTAVAVYVLRMLDAHWQIEAGNRPAQQQTIEKPACWEVNGCSPEQRKDCPGYVSPLPCWQARRTANGYMREECLGCGVFLKAPAPIAA
jgi:hypothetical protein